MSGTVDLLIAGLVLLGAAFVLIGSWGLVRLPSTMERLHGPTKVTTLGLGALLLASVAYFQARLGIWTAHELLISLFLFITAPISANMIAKVHLHRARIDAADEPEGLAGAPPRPDEEGEWATFAAPAQDTPRGDGEHVTRARFRPATLHAHRPLLGLAFVLALTPVPTETVTNNAVAIIMTRWRSAWRRRRATIRGR